MNRFGLSRFSCQGLFSTRGALERKRLQTRLQPVQLHGPIKDIKNNCSCDIAHPPGARRRCGSVLTSWATSARTFTADGSGSRTPSRPTRTSRSIARVPTWRSSHPFRAELLATSPPACRLASGPRNSPRDSWLRMKSSGTRSGFQQPSAKDPLQVEVLNKEGQP